MLFIIFIMGSIIPILVGNLPYYLLLFYIFFLLIFKLEFILILNTGAIMCLALDTKCAEYTINIADIVSGLYFAWFIGDICNGWSTTIFILSVIGFIGFFLKFCAQCYRKEIRTGDGHRKRLYWQKPCHSAYFFGVIIELFFEGACLGVIEAVIVGNGQIIVLLEHAYLVGYLVLSIKFIYCLYMVFKYCLISNEDHLKIWFVLMAIATLLIVYSVAFCTLFDIFSGMTTANCL
eukprot:1115473_1